MALADFLNYDFGNVIFKASWDENIQNKTNNSFWKNWLNTRYNLELTDDTLNYRRLAERTDYIIAKMKEFNISMTFRSFKYILLNEDISPVDAFFKKAKKNSFIICGDIRVLKVEYYVSFEGEDSNDNFINPSNANLPFFSNLSPVGKRNYKKYVDKVLVNTKYILPSGELKTVGYDADADKYVRMHLYAELGVDKRWDALSDIGEAIYMRHFY